MEQEIEFTQINNDADGNQRYVCHFLNLVTDNDRHCTEGWGLKQTDILYQIAIKRANKIGGKKFHNKQYGGGIVFSSSDLNRVKINIKEILK